MTPGQVRQLAVECGFDLAGVARAGPVPDYSRYQQWIARGSAGAMGYLTDRRGDLREDPRSLLPSARSVICVGKLYHTPEPLSLDAPDPRRGWVSRYAWGNDYHYILRSGLERLAARLREICGGFEYKVCVDTAPLLERSLARQAGLGWIGKNTCLINQEIGSWIFLGELLVSLEIDPGEPPPDRCGTCTRCIDACPTAAIIPENDGWTLDARLCISYLTIELRGEIPGELREGVGRHVFGCDICQDVCPWNRRAPLDAGEEFQAREVAPSLDRLAALTQEEFNRMFSGSPVRRAKYAGFLRNVAVAIGNSGDASLRPALANLAESEYPDVAAHARWALEKLDHCASMRMP